MNKDLGYRLQGFSVGLYLMIAIQNIGGLYYPAWIRVLSTIIVIYFMFFGVSRFEPGYKKTI